jgi:hypothetical protein
VTPAPYTVGQIISFSTDNGPGFSACLYENGRMVAVVMDDEEQPGFLLYRWRERDARRRLLDYVEGRGLFPDLAGFDPQNLRVARADRFVAELVDADLSERNFRNLCTQKTLFRLSGDAEGEYRSLSNPWSPQARAYLIETFGDRLIEVLNERFSGLP